MSQPRGWQRGSVPGNLMAGCETLSRFGKLSLDQVMEPAIRHAERGFRVTPYLSSCIEQVAEDLALDPEIPSIFLPNGKPLNDGDLLVQATMDGRFGRSVSAVPSAFMEGRWDKT